MDRAIITRRHEHPPCGVEREDERGKPVDFRATVNFGKSGARATFGAREAHGAQGRVGARVEERYQPVS